MAGKGSNTENFKTVTGTECPWALDQSDSGKRSKRKGKEVEVFMAMQLLIFWKSAIFLWEDWETGQGGQNSKVAPKTPPSYASSPPTWVGMSLRNMMYVTFMSMLHYMKEGILQM